MCRLRNIAMRDYKESVTTGQTPDKVIPIRLLEISPSHFGHLASLIGPNKEMYCDVLLD